MVNLQVNSWFSDDLKPGVREQSDKNSVSLDSANHMSNKLFVGNLSFKTTENELQDAFSAFGTVTEANLMMDRMTNRPRGFGFVTMSSADEAQKAIEGMNGKEVDGRALTVNIARPREERPAGGGGGGGRREFGGGNGGGGGRRERY
jgi:RNA recognition motif-containing protein